MEEVELLGNEEDFDVILTSDLGIARRALLKQRGMHIRRGRPQVATGTSATSRDEVLRRTHQITDQQVLADLVKEKKALVDTRLYFSILANAVTSVDMISNSLPKATSLRNVANGKMDDGKWFLLTGMILKSGIADTPDDAGVVNTAFGALAKEIANSLNAEIEFVQFHPSFDYTDLVEGLRPTPPDENGNIGFERKDGVFKEFCKKALKANTSFEVDNFDESWEKLLELVKNNLSNGNLTQIGSWSYGLSTKDSLKYSSLNTPSQYSFTITKQNVYDAYQNKQARPSGAFQKDMEDVVNFMKSQFHLKDYQEGTILHETENKKFVFIIDEINRGEISKIFGELFFSLDPGYRGAENKVRTQYSNLIESGDVFFEGFFVPENVYIIGTMNDIDRSVESFDFAMRRRFAWKEIKAIDRISMWDGVIDKWKDESLKRMISINTKIETIQGLGSAFHIGPAYFIKLKNYNGNFEQLWDNHLSGVLFEYLRGLPEKEKRIEELNAAYNIKAESITDATNN